MTKKLKSSIGSSRIKLALNLLLVRRLYPQSRLKNVITNLLVT